jgi:hypothetical protein
MFSYICIPIKRLKSFHPSDRLIRTQWRHKSKISEKLGRCGRQNILQPYLKIWDWDWIFGHAVKAISSLGVRSPWFESICPNDFAKIPLQNYQPQESPLLQLLRRESHKSYKGASIKAYLLLQGLSPAIPSNCYFDGLRIIQWNSGLLSWPAFFSIYKRIKIKKIIIQNNFERHFPRNCQRKLCKKDRILFSK